MNLFPLYYEGNDHNYLGAHLFLLLIFNGTLTARGTICAEGSFLSAHMIFNNKEQAMACNLRCQKEKRNLSSLGEPVRMVLQEAQRKGLRERFLDPLQRG